MEQILIDERECLSSEYGGERQLRTPLTSGFVAFQDEEKKVTVIQHSYQGALDNE